METFFDEPEPEDLEFSLQELAAVCPERVIRYMQVHGLEALGQFDVRDSYVIAAFRKSGSAGLTQDSFLTLGGPPANFVAARRGPH